MLKLSLGIAHNLCVAFRLCVDTELRSMLRSLSTLAVCSDLIRWYENSDIVIVLQLTSHNSGPEYIWVGCIKLEKIRSEWDSNLMRDWKCFDSNQSFKLHTQYKTFQNNWLYMFQFTSLLVSALFIFTNNFVLFGF